MTEIAYYTRLFALLVNAAALGAQYATTLTVQPHNVVLTLLFAAWIVRDRMVLAR